MTTLVFPFVTTVQNRMRIRVGEMMNNFLDKLSQKITRQSGSGFCMIEIGKKKNMKEDMLKLDGNKCQLLFSIVVWLRT